MFSVQRRMCATCIYRPDSPLDLQRLEDEVRDPHVGFRGHRICHHAPNGSQVCCRGFWNAHKNEFPAGQLAQRLGVVRFVDVDSLKRTKSIKMNAASKQAKASPVEAGVPPWIDVLPNGDDLRIEDFLTFRLNRLSNLLRTRFTNRYLQPFKLNIPEWRLLGFIGARKGLRSVEIVRLSGMDKGHVSRCAKSMQKRGLLTMRADLTITVTPRGASLYRSILAVARKHQAALLLQLEKEERTILYRALDKLTENYSP